MKEAMFYEKLDENKVKCFLCAHHCEIKEGKRGICYVRKNIDGTLHTLVYGRVVSMNIDPIEKKPLFHFQIGSTSFSIAAVGCNFRCEHCQNFEISQYPKLHEGEILGQHVTPEAIVEAARRNGCKSISYTYTEPTIFFEFAYDCAKLAHEKGIKNVFVSNGYTTPEATKVIAPYLDGNNIDLKEIAEFIKSVDPFIPWHVTQFYPTYKLTDKPRTPLKTLRRAKEIGFETGLKYVYEGNVPGEGGENTFCHQCKKLLIKRFGFSIIENRMKNGKCTECGAEIKGVWS